VPKVGELLAVIEDQAVKTKETEQKIDKEVERVRQTIDSVKQEKKEVDQSEQDLKSRTPSGKFISPLVRSMASKEGVGYDELDKITGTGMDGRNL
ncbi:MAG TPA: E3 binding domain-containing protein, partial [Bacteroidales bacterium]|nr:E3 binding domain-containing protein [Bacteroidales bacterium]